MKTTNHTWYTKQSLSEECKYKGLWKKSSISCYYRITNSFYKQIKGIIYFRIKLRKQSQTQIFSKTGDLKNSRKYDSVLAYLRLELLHSISILFSTKLSSKNWFDSLFGGFSWYELVIPGCLWEQGSTLSLILY